VNSKNSTKTDFYKFSIIRRKKEEEAECVMPIPID